MNLNHCQKVRGMQKFDAIFLEMHLLKMNTFSISSLNITTSLLAKLEVRIWSNSAEFFNMENLDYEVLRTD